MNNLIKNKIPKYYRLKIGEYWHRYKFRRIYENQKIADEDFKKCSNKKSYIQIKKEIRLIQDYWKCYPLHYFRYYLYKKEKQLSNEELLNYIPEYFFYAVFLRFYDNGQYDILRKDKNLMDGLFRSVNIPTANTIFKIVRGQIYDVNYKLVSPIIFEEIIKTVCSDKIFIKPASGQGGFGITVFNRNNNRYVKNRDIMNYKFLVNLSKIDDWIIQEGIIQNEELNILNPSSVNTFRIITKNDAGKVKILISVLRIGIENKDVDNSAQGGISCQINLENGSFKSYATSEHPYKKYGKHPNSNIEFSQYHISFYDGIKNFVINNASKLPFFKIIAWDIAVSDHDLLALEFNTGFGLDHLQYACNGLRENFEIDNPNYYWNLIKGDE